MPTPTELVGKGGPDRLRAALQHSALPGAPTLAQPSLREHWQRVSWGDFLPRDWSFGFLILFLTSRRNYLFSLGKVKEWRAPNPKCGSYNLQRTPGGAERRKRE